MKKLITLLTFNFLLLTFVPAQEFGWVDLSENIPTTVLLTDLYIIGDTIWVSTYTVNPPHYIYYSTDGGQTFVTQETESDINSICMLSSTEGFAGGQDGYPYYKTDTNDWTRLPFMGGLGSPIHSITFPPSSSDGWCCGGGNVGKLNASGIYHKNNIANGNFLSISCPSDTSEVWAVDIYSIFYYEDGQWEIQGISAFTNSICFVPNTTIGWTVGNDGRIFHTINGGNFWDIQANPDTILTRTLMDVFFLNEQEGWAVGNQGIILHTVDGGNNWIIEANGLTNENLSAVHFDLTASGNVGYAVGSSGTLLKCTKVSGIGEKSEFIESDIFPNPAKNKIQIVCSGFNTENGKMMIEHEIEKGNENIVFDLSSLESGMYLCKISVGKKSSTKKIILE